MKELRIDATIENLDRVLAFLDTELEGIDCPMKEQMQLDVAVEEIFVNIASYAYQPGTGDALIQVESLDGPKRVEVTFVDSGVPYNPLLKEDPDVTLSVEERQIGGLGIYMVKKSMDDMTYEYKDNKNILKIIKCI
jgi:anti-sigma regulatory factor (Ser/Thr protein kinase)